MNLSELVNELMIGTDYFDVKGSDMRPLYQGHVLHIPEELLSREVMDFGEGDGTPKTIVVMVDAPRDAWDRFVEMVGRYKSMGVRMVCFDNPENVGGSWIMAFNTHGTNANQIPIERFDTPYVKSWMRWYGFDGPMSEVSHMDVTEDFDEMYEYDYEGRFLVNQLA